MDRRKVSRYLVILLIPVLFSVGVLAVVFTASQHASAQEISAGGRESGQFIVQQMKPGDDMRVQPDGGLGMLQSQPGVTAATLEPTTTLTVTIYSHPFATLDSNDPAGVTEVVPRVFPLEAVVTNTGSTTATNLVVNLDYDEDPVAGWQLLPGEDPIRVIPTLDPGASSVFYWFATYPITDSLGHVYTATASADNAAQVFTDDNVYGNPAPGETVLTRGALSTGNSALSQSQADVIVGVAFTMSVGYDKLGVNPQSLTVSPAGNDDFNANAYRLLRSQLTLYDDAGTQEQTLVDQLYVPELPPFAENLTATFTFLAVTLTDVRLCPYAAIGYSQNVKYDTTYCSDAPGAVVTVTSSSNLSLTLSKIPDDPTIRQNEQITYSLDYENIGDVDLNNIWIWDEYDLGLGSIITSSATPPGDPAETSASRIAWFFDQIPASGQPGSSGTLTFTTLVDGNGQDLADQTSLVNRASYGIGQFGFPDTAADTASVTTTVQAPVLQLSKTDGLADINAGNPASYTLSVANEGSIAATSVVITDTLPSGVQYVDGAAGETGRIGQELVWDNIGSIQPGASVFITIPVTVDAVVANGTLLTNTMAIGYGNGAGHAYQPGTAQDTTEVLAPSLAISKQAFPDPIFAGRSLTYTLNYSNTGPGQATNAVITDTLPAGTTYDQCVGGSTCGVSAGVVSWTLGDLSIGSGSVSFSVVVSDELANESVLTNDLYGIWSDQTGLVTGPPETATVLRSAGWFQGTAFVDGDGDGQFDVGVESPLAGVTVTLASATVPEVTTDASGTYLFRVEKEQPVSLETTLPAGYFRTTPGTVNALNVFEITKTIDFGYASDSSGFAVILGTVYEDTDANGIRDVAELGISGVPVSLDNSINATTDIYGRYNFTTTLAEIHSVVETDPDSYLSTTPNEVQVDVSLNNAYEVDFGDIQDTSGLAAVFGTVYEDTNGNGQRDADEPGIPNVTVTFDDSQNTLTDAFGRYSFSTDTAGFHKVVESDPNNYISTTPNEVQIDVNLNSDYQVDFGDIQDTAGLATIFGTVYEDSNGNGQRDDGEPGIPGVTVTLDDSENALTDAYGRYSFSTTTAGFHTIAETDPDNYLSTTPNEVQVDVSLNNDYQVDFGDIQDTAGLATIFGTVYEDTDGNGQRDDGEPGIPGVTVTFDDSENTLTDAFGRYSFSTNTAEVHSVTETDPANYLSTTPNRVQFAVNLNSDYQVDFGDIQDTAGLAAIFGTVYEDINGNGQRDDGDPGIPGVTVTLDVGENTLTDAYGRYSFSTTTPGSHTVTETDPTDYLSTTPNEVQVDVSLNNDYVVDFGDSYAGACGPDGYEEDDASTSASALALNTNQDHDFCDDAADWFEFEVEAGKVYTVTTSSWGRRADTFMTLYDVDAQTVLVANDDYAGTTDHSSRIVWTAVGDGTYYVQITNLVGLTGANSDYEIDLQGPPPSTDYYLFLPIVFAERGQSSLQQAAATALLQPTGIINHTCPDAYETNDTWMEATPLVSGVAQRHSFDSNPALYAADKDYVSFDLPANSTFTATISDMTNTSTLMELYDDQGNALNVTGTSQLVWSGQPAGRYYLRISPTTLTYGCSEEVGYTLETGIETTGYSLFLPLIARES